MRPLLLAGWLPRLPAVKAAQEKMSCRAGGLSGGQEAAGGLSGGQEAAGGLSGGQEAAMVQERRWWCRLVGTKGCWASAWLPALFRYGPTMALCLQRRIGMKVVTVANTVYLTVLN